MLADQATAAAECDDVKQSPITILCANHETETNGFRQEHEAQSSVSADEIEQSMVDEDSTDDELGDSDPLPFSVEPALQVHSVAIFKPDHSHSRVSGEITITDPLVTQPPSTIPCENQDTEINGFQQQHEAQSSISADEIEQSIVDEDSTDDELDGTDPLPFSVEPALQVLSVAIFKPDHSHSRVSGEITITDPNRKIKYYIYKGDKDKLQPGWNDLLLTRGPVASVMGGYVHFELTSEEDATDPIFNHNYDMNKATGEFVDRKFTLEGNGNCGYRCKVVFTNTPFAAIAKVYDILVVPPSPPPLGKEFYLLHGKITINGIVCFETKLEGALKVKYAKNQFKGKTSIPIHTTVYVVPVDSPLTVDVDLNCESINTKRRLVMNACTGVMHSHFKCEAGGFVFLLELHWYIPYHFFDQDVQLVSEPKFSRFIKIFGPWVTGALVEVFSMSVGGGKSEAPCDIDLYGAFVVTDGKKHFNILTGKKDLPCKLPSSSEKDEEQFRTLALKWPDDRWVVGEGLNMNFKLKDVKSNLLCAGEASWYGEEDVRYDMRLCDVWKGENGHLAALHYSVFKNAKMAKIRVECSNGPYSIYGSVFAQYNNYDYSSAYEKQCFRSMLFRRSEELPLVAKRLRIPLLKSQVAAPFDCNELIVCVDLWVRPLNASFPHKRFTFNTKEAGSCDMIWGRLMVKVEWICG